LVNLLGLALLGALATPDQPLERPLPVLQHLYVQHCARCHGLDGSATSPEGSRLKGLDFTSVREMQGRTDQELAQTIAKGLLFGLKMPAFKDVFSEPETRTLVREVLRKARKGKAIAEPGNPGPAR
jgi:mono/diheme cytochrome c family protein